MGPRIPLFWTAGDICPRVQNQGRFPRVRASLPQTQTIFSLFIPFSVNRSLDFTRAIFFHQIFSLIIYCTLALFGTMLLLGVSSQLLLGQGEGQGRLPRTILIDLKVSTGQARLIRSYSLARISIEISGNTNYPCILDMK